MLTACVPSITASKKTATTGHLAAGNSINAVAGPIVAMFIINRRTFHRSHPPAIRTSATWPLDNEHAAVRNHGSADASPLPPNENPSSLAR